MMMKSFIASIICFMLMSDLIAFQDQGSVISGKITDSDGRGLAGAGITIAGTFRGVHSADDGSFSLTGLKDGNYLLDFTFIGYESQRTEVNLKGKAELNISLAPKSFMAGEVIVNAIRAGNHTPLAYTTVGQEILQKQNLGMDLPYILGLTPSLVETSEAGTGIGYTNLRIRGSDASRINVTIDGIPLNDPESQQVFWVDLPDLTSSVDNLQVQRGVGSSSNGAGAFGATISIQTKSLDNEPYAQISATGGSFGTLRKMIAAGTGLLADKFALQVRFSDLKSDGYIYRTGSDHRSAYISGLFRSGRSRLKANIIIGEEKTGIGWWGVPSEMLKTNRQYNPAGEYTDDLGEKRFYENETDNYWQNHYQLLYNYNVSEHLNLSSALHYTYGTGYYEEFKEDQAYSDYGLHDLIVGGINISSTDMIRRKWMSNDFYGIIWSLRYGKGRINASLGGGANSYSGDHFGKILWMRTSGPVESNYQWYLNNGTKTEISMFGKTEYELSDKFTAYGDLQFRYINYDMNGIDDDLKDLRQNHDFGFFNPKAGLFWSLSPDQDAYLSFAVANREPARSDFKEATGDPEAMPMPERLYDTELGYKLRRNNISAGVNLYGMIYYNQLVPTGELSDVGYPVMTNVKNSYRLGIELSTSLKPASFIGWDLNLTISRNKILDFVEYYQDYDTITWDWEYKNREPGNTDISYSPSVTGTSDLNFKILKSLKLHFVSKYVGKQYFDNTMNNERMIDPYFINSLRFDYNPVIPRIQSAEFQFLINNIFNHEYESNAYGGNWYEEGIEKTWAYYFPQAGINFMIKAALTF